MHIFRKKSLIPTIETAKERQNYLTSVVMSADHKIHIPHLARITEDEAVRAMGQHDLQPVRVLKILEETPRVIRSRRSIIVAVETESIIVHSSEAYLYPIDLNIHIFLVQHYCTGRFKLLCQFRMTVFHIIDLMISKRIVNGRRILQFPDQSNRDFRILRFSIQHIPVHENQIGSDLPDLFCQFFIVLSEFMVVQIRDDNCPDRMICSYFCCKLTDCQKID